MPWFGLLDYPPFWPKFGLMRSASEKCLVPQLFIYGPASQRILLSWLVLALSLPRHLLTIFGMVGWQKMVLELLLVLEPSLFQPFSPYA